MQLFLLFCRTLNKDKAPIQITKKYWDLRESVVKCELLFLRVLCFQVTVENPHKVNMHAYYTVCIYSTLDYKL